MILSNLRLAGKDDLLDIHIEDDRIIEVSGSDNKKVSADRAGLIDLTGASVFPGLINSHDHLDFNLFPPLAHRIYSNYTEWGNEIQRVDKELIEKVLKVPKDLRVRWGLYKNLLNGFTTVVNHGDKLTINDEFITVFQDQHILHSPAFEKNWKWKLNQPFRGRLPFVMHLGEGTDLAAGSEIDEVIRANIFHRRIIAVHGVAMSEKQAPNFEAVVWCPCSNFFLLKKTAAIDKLKKKTKIVFGTDSTLTSSWNAWTHFRMARETGMMNDEEILSSLTIQAAQLWDLKDTGEIRAGMKADIVVANKKTALFDTNPDDILLVMKNGKIRMWDKGLEPQLNGFSSKEFGKMMMNGSIKYVPGDIEGLMAAIKEYGVQTNL